MGFTRMNRVAEGFTRESGTNIRTVQELLGHTCVETTMIYLHVMEDDKDLILNPLDSL